MKKIFVLLACAMFAFILFPAAKIHAGYLGITTTSLPDAIAGQPYSYQLQASGSNPPFIWSTLSTTYPSACCVLGVDTNTGVFNTQSSATVLSNYTGTYSWTFQVKDAIGNTATKTFSLTINPASQPILILSSAFVSFNYQKGGIVPAVMTMHITNNSESQTITYTISVPNQPTWLNTNYTTTPLPLVPLQSAGVGIAINPTNLAVGTYTTTIYFTGNFSNSPASIAVTLNVTDSNPTFIVVSGLAHPNNTNVVGPDGTVYLIQNGFRSPYTSAGAFLSYGFNSWANVVPATTGDMSLPLNTYTPSGASNTTTYFIPPRNGSLINDRGTIYLITNGLRIGFASAQAFLGLGYSFANARSGDTSFMVALAPINSEVMSHPDGTLVNDSGTVYIMKNNTRMGFPNMQVFYSWGLRLNEVVLANSYDRAAPVSGTITTRMANQLSI